MSNAGLVAIREFCTQQNIELRFIDSLQEFGLIEITTIGEDGFIATHQLQQLEKWVRFHYEMDINLEGIEAITHLLQRVGSLQEEVARLKNRLDFYEMNT